MSWLELTEVVEWEGSSVHLSIHIGRMLEVSQVKGSFGKEYQIYWARLCDVMLNDISNIANEFQVLDLHESKAWADDSRLSYIHLLRLPSWIVIEQFDEISG